MAALIKDTPYAIGPTLRPRVWDLSLETFESQLRQLRLLGCWSRSQLGFPRSEPSERSKHLAHLQGCSCGHRCKRQQWCGGSRWDLITTLVWMHFGGVLFKSENVRTRHSLLEQRLERAQPVLIFFAEAKQPLMPMTSQAPQLLTGVLWTFTAKLAPTLGPSHLGCVLPTRETLKCFASSNKWNTSWSAFVVSNQVLVSYLYLHKDWSCAFGMSWSWTTLKSLFAMSCRSIAG